MLVGGAGCDAASWGAVEEADLEQIRFDHYLDRVFFFVDRGGDSAQADRAAVKFLDNSLEQLGVHFVEAKAVDLHAVERVTGDVRVDMAFVIDLCKITDPPQQPVDDTRRSPPAFGDLVRALLVDSDI